MESLKQTIMQRDGISSDEANEQINAAREELQELIESGDHTAAYDICADHFGLEPDFLMDLL